VQLVVLLLLNSEGSGANLAEGARSGVKN